MNFFSQHNQMIIFLLVTMRIGAIMFTLPLMSSRSIPNQIKILFVFLLSFGLFPMVQNQQIATPDSLMPLALLAIGELLIGFIIGFVAQIFFITAQIAGEIISQQMGLSLAIAFNPQLSQPSTLITDFQYALSILLFFSLSAHHWFILSIAESLRIVPLLQVSLPQALGTALLTFLGNTFVSAIKIAAPLMVILLLVAISMGILARLVPQMNIFVLSFPLNVGTGLLVLSLSLVFVFKEMRLVFDQLGQACFLVIRLLGQG